MKTILKILTYIIALVFGLILLAVILIQTSWFKDMAKKQIETIANQQLNGTLEIGEIDGTIIGSFYIKDISITQNKTSILFCNKISLDYNLMGILSKSIKINSAIIDTFSLKMSEMTDSSWNITQLLKTSDEVDTTSSAFDWNIEIGEFRINNSVISISVLDSTLAIPKNIKDINLSAKASILPEYKSLKIDDFSFFTESPDLSLKNLLLQVKLSGQLVEIPYLTISTAANKINFAGKYFIDNSQESKIDLATDPIDFSELKKFLPLVNLYGNPVIKLKGSYKNPGANIELSIIDNLQKAKLTAKINDLNSTPSYLTELEVNNINIGYWLKDSSMNTDINGSLKLDGSGTTLNQMNLMSDLSLNDSELLERNIEMLKLKLFIKDNNLELKLNLLSEFGEIVSNINFSDIDQIAKFNINTDVKNLNTAPLLLDNSLSSNLNFSLSASGTNFNPDKMNAIVSLFVDSSSFMKYSIDSVNSNFNINDGIYTVNQFKFVNDAALIKLDGKISPNKLNDIYFNVTTKDLTTLPQLEEIDNVKINGNISGQVNGQLDSLSVKVNYNFNDIVFQTNSAEVFIGEFDLLKLGNSLSANLNSSIENINISETLVKNVQLDAHYLDNEIKSNLGIDLNENASASINSIVKIDSVVSVILPQFQLSLSDSVWSNFSDSIKFTINENNYRINNFNLSNKNQSIYLDGTITPDKNDLELSIDNLNIFQLLKIIDDKVDASGIIDAELIIGGNFAKPTVDGKIDILNLTYQDKGIGDLDSKFTLADEILIWDIELDNYGNKIISDGFIPFIINADSSQSMIPGNQQFNVNLKIDSLELNNYSALINEVNEMEGLVISDFKLYNTLNELKGNGYFRVNNANFESEILGVIYDNININLEADSQKFYIREFEINNDEGKLIIDGFAGYDGGLLAGKINQLKIDFEAKDFEIIQSQNLEVKIDGKLQLRDKGDEGIIDGRISILRSKVYLPYFTNAVSGKDYDQNKPILIKELEKNNISKDAENLSSIKTVSDSLDQPEFISNINGQFTLSIPRNTWITSPDMNIELSGEIDVIKNLESIELFGAINTVRGQFAIYGKEFSIVEGNINFSGGKELNPNLNIILEYIFRSADRTKKNLELIIEGSAQNPKLTFSLDGSNIDEGNAISYLLFGKSIDQLTQSQQNDVSNSEANFAKTLAGNLLAAQLSSTVGGALGLDVIEISGNEGWQQASLTAGKYLTDDLYVSYERGFGSSETNEVNPRIVTMEYQLTKFLYFQLVEGNDKTSGFDVVIKFAW